MLRSALGCDLAGRGGLVLIGGEAGIGKTALAEDLAETPPYGPWAEAVGGRRADYGRASLSAPLGCGEAPPSQAALQCANSASGRFP